MMFNDFLLGLEEYASGEQARIETCAGCVVLEGSRLPGTPAIDKRVKEVA